MGLFSGITGALTGGLLGGGGGGGGGGLNVGGPGQHSSTNLSQNTSTNYATNNSNSGSTLEYNFLGNPSSITLADQGAIQQAFNFATAALGQSYGALNDSQSNYNDTAEALRNAYQQSLSFVGKTTAPADTQTQQQMTWLVWGVLGFAALFVLSKNK